MGRIATALVVISVAAGAGADGAKAQVTGTVAGDGANPADGAGLIWTAPVYPPVVPPEGYRQSVARGVRTGDGRPGPRYWQQKVDYDIDVSLDPATARVEGSETVILHNDSPDTIPQVVLHLYQNVFSAGVPRNRTLAALTGGMTVTRLAVDGTELEEMDQAALRQRMRTQGPAAMSGAWIPMGTLGYIRLPEPLAPGDSLRLEADWNFEVPADGTGFRLGQLDHEVYNIAQWYPQVAVYDDVFGQDASPYLGNGEFYTEFGDFRVRITVPEGWLVVGTGMLQDPDDVLRPEAVRRLQGAAALDTVVAVVSAADREAGRATRDVPGDRLTWEFAADSVRDFAWATSIRYVWHATGAKTGSPRGRALIQNVFDPQVEEWAKATLYAKHAIEFYSGYMLPYPYPQATAAMGPRQVNGMEYPMITFITYEASGRGLNGVVSHELSHFWVPMIVGSKEMAYAWMDEGLTTFNNSLSMADYYDQPVTPNDQGYLQAVKAGVEAPIMQHTDYVESPFGRSLAAYGKPGMLLHSLRHMIGKEAFDAGYRDYYRTWAFKHAMPWDFFARMEAAAGTDLDWFWQPWFYDTYTLDQAVESVKPGTGGVEITVANRADAVMPVELRIEGAGGAARTVVWPPAVWAGTRTVTRTVPFEGEVTAVKIDPDGWYPDTDRSNNDWEAAGS